MIENLEHLNVLLNKAVERVLENTMCITKVISIEVFNTQSKRVIALPLLTLF